MIRPDEVLELFWPYVNNYVPTPGEPESYGPPMLLMLVNEQHQVISGPAYVEDGDVVAFLNRVQPSALPGAHRITEAVLAAEVIARMNDQPDIRKDAIAIWGIDRVMSYKAMLPFARVVTGDATTEVIMAEPGTPGGPDQIHQEIAEVNFEEDAILAALFGIVDRDPADPVDPDIEIRYPGLN